MKKIILATLGAGLLAIGMNANATKDTSTINPYISIVGACSVGVDMDANFGLHNAGTEVIHEINHGTLSVNCPDEYVVGADIGSHGEQIYRYLRDPQNPDPDAKITYILRLNGGLVWGDGGLNAKDGSYTETLGTHQAHSGAGDANVQTFSIGGEVYLQGSESVGNYSDVVTVTLAW